MDSYKKNIPEQWTLESARPYFLFEVIKNRRWIFVYLDKSGQAHSHVITRLTLGKLTIYKNGSTVFTNHLGKLIHYLSKGEVMISPRSCMAA